MKLLQLFVIIIAITVFVSCKTASEKYTVHDTVHIEKKLDTVPAGFLL